MKRILLACMLLMGSIAYGQTIYYWVGSSAANNNISTNSNWNTMLNGSGSSRGSSTGSGDILVFDGTNLGGATPVTGPVNVNINTSITCAAMRFINGANISMGRTTAAGGGTSTVSLNGDGTPAADFFIDASSTATIVSGNGNSRFSPVAGVTTIAGLVNGNFRMITNQQMRFDNGTTGTGKLVFTSGSSFTSNITGASSYPFGSGTQSAEKWAVFEAGSHLYYEGGNSPMASSAVYQPIDFKPGSFYHHRANNSGAGGNFFNRKSYADIIVENSSVLTIDGPIYRIDNLTITNGSSVATPANSVQTAVLGNIVVDGSLTSPAGSTHELILAGNNPQTISGTGTISVANLQVASNASVTLLKDISVAGTATIYGKINFGTNHITGAGAFTAYGALSAGNAIGNLTAGAYHIPGTGIAASQIGLLISGTGITPNTSIVGFSSTGDSIYLSAPITVSGTGVALTLSGKASVLQTANTNGFDPATGSVGVAGTQTFNDGINYIINGATAWPFGITTAGAATPITMDFLEVTAPITLNRSFTVSDHLTVNGKITLRPLDVAHLTSTAALNGVFNTNNYIVTGHDIATGNRSYVQVDGLVAPAFIPVGSPFNYLPVSIAPSANSGYTVSVFEGITANGLVNGTGLSAAQKLRLVNAVWTINQVAGSGNAVLQLQWAGALEGATFVTLPNTDIGLISNNGSSWSLPTGTADNSTNTVSASISTFGAFGIGAVPPSVPFVFNPLPVRTYGEVDFGGGASSLNTTQPINYSSDNTAVATIVGGLIHIVGAGTANITASQATDGVYPAASITQQLTVNKAPLTITADNKTKFEQTPNPALTATYSGFVYSETPAALLTPAVLSTTAVLASPPGTYPITVNGATSNNYAITFVNGTLTVQPKTTQTLTFPAITAKTYGNANFASNVTSTNNTIPITLVSSNTNVATIVAGNQIHIVGAGTSDITASQAGNDGYFPATPITRSLTVNKANLTIRVRDTSRVEQTPNPPFTITYTGFVLGETVANLLTPPVATTTADLNSSPGYYPITLGSATSNNYNITYTNGRLTVLPANNAQQTLNPYQSSSNVLTVRVYSNEPRIADIILYDLSGRPIMKKNLFMPAGFISTDMNIGTLASGIYIVKLKGPVTDMSKTVRIIH